MPRPENCPRVTALICALNEAECLPHVLPKIPTWVDEVLLVDGHSTDKTFEVAQELYPSIKLLRQPGRGKGDALKHGIGNATGDIIVTLDADGQTNPEEMEFFIKPLLEGYDFTKGSRLTSKRPARMQRHRWFGNKVLALTCNILYGTRFSDICSGYNAFRKESFLQLDLSCGKNEIGCSMEQQMIVKAKKAGMKIKEVPHLDSGRIAGASVIIGIRKSVNQGFRDLFIIIRERFSD